MSSMMLSLVVLEMTRRLRWIQQENLAGNGRIHYVQ